MDLVLRCVKHCVIRLLCPSSQMVRRPSFVLAVAVGTFLSQGSVIGQWESSSSKSGMFFSDLILSGDEQMTSFAQEVKTWRSYRTKSSGCCCHRRVQKVYQMPFSHRIKGGTLSTGPTLPDDPAILGPVFDSSLTPAPAMYLAV